MNKSSSQSDSPFCVIEGPAWGDAEFLAKWLASAADAEMRWKQAKRQREFSKQIVSLTASYIPNFGIAATLFISKLLNNGASSLVFDLGWQGTNELVMMIRLGFFKPTCGRYQMIVPEHLDIELIKGAALELVRTEDEEYMLHPEDILVHMSKDEARACRKRLRYMDQRQRIRERSRLLGDAVHRSYA